MEQVDATTAFPSPVAAKADKAAMGFQGFKIPKSHGGCAEIQFHTKICNIE
jgi:hypothetical protein